MVSVPTVTRRIGRQTTVLTTLLAGSEYASL